MASAGNGRKLPGIHEDDYESVIFLGIPTCLTIANASYNANRDRQDDVEEYDIKHISVQWGANTTLSGLHVSMIAY